MKNSKLLLIAAFILGFVFGAFVWQRLVTEPLLTENQSLRGAANESARLTAENARLANEQTDPEELQRLRDGQTELLRLRGQLVQLRQDLKTARAETAQAARQREQAASATPAASEVPVDTFTANVTATVGWKQMLVTGGWRLPSGKRAFVLLRPRADAGDNVVNLESQVFNSPDDALLPLGLDALRAPDQASPKNGILSAEDASLLLARLKQTEGIDLLGAPQVSTLSGEQAQISVTQSHALPNGQAYTTGPTIDVRPTIGPDKRTVELVVGVQLNLERSTSP